MASATHLSQLPDSLGWAALAAVSGAVAIKDEQLCYAWANSAFTTLFSMPLASIRGKTDDELFVDGPLLPDPATERRVLTSGRADERYETLSFADGRVRETLMTTSRIEVDDRSFLVVMLHDITEVAAANHSLVAATEHLAAESIELRAQALRDPLTGLLNLRGFETMAPTALLSAGQKGAVLMLDLDNFKSINDAHGHEVGDNVLRTVADALRECTREERDVIARLGGDEFVVAMPRLPEDEARVIVDRIRSVIADRPVATSVAPLVPAVSIGVALSPSNGPLELREWRRHADEALYAAKRAGKDQAVIQIIS